MLIGRHTRLKYSILTRCTMYLDNVLTGVLTGRKMYLLVGQYFCFLAYIFFAGHCLTINKLSKSTICSLDVQSICKASNTLEQTQNVLARRTIYFLTCYVLTECILRDTYTCCTCNTRLDTTPSC